jgi:hypothetical protein
VKIGLLLQPNCAYSFGVSCAQFVALYKSSAGYLMRSTICIPSPAQPVEGDYDRFPAHARLGQMARLARTSVTGSETPI